MIWIVWADSDVPVGVDAPGDFVAVYDNEAAAQLHLGDLPDGWITAHEIKSNYQAEDDG